MSRQNRWGYFGGLALRKYQQQLCHFRERRPALDTLSSNWIFLNDRWANSANSVLNVLF
jgi:hypothetical protein